MSSDSHTLTVWASIVLNHPCSRLDLIAAGCLKLVALYVSLRWHLFLRINAAAIHHDPALVRWRNNDNICMPHAQVLADALGVLAARNIWHA